MIDGAKSSKGVVLKPLLIVSLNVTTFQVCPTLRTSPVPVDGTLSTSVCEKPYR